VKQRINRVIQGKPGHQGKPGQLSIGRNIMAIDKFFSPEIQRVYFLDLSSFI
jgi:hypothetical protein